MNNSMRNPPFNQFPRYPNQGQNPLTVNPQMYQDPNVLAMLSRDYQLSQQQLQGLQQLGTVHIG